MHIFLFRLVGLPTHTHTQARINSSSEFAKDGVKIGFPVAIAAASKDSGLVAVITSSSLVLLRDGQVASTLDLKYRPTCLAFNHDDTELAIGGDSKDKKAHYYSIEKDTAKDTGVVFDEHGKKINWVAYSPLGGIRLTAGGDRCIHIHKADNVEDTLNIGGWAFHDSGANQFKFSPDGKRACSVGGEDIIVWRDMEKFTSSRWMFKRE
jgi:WD40 repeat protein